MLNDFVMSDRTVLMRAAKLFKCGMCNTDVLILYDINNSNLLEQFEFKFFDYNFFHLTGLRYTKSSCYAQMKGKDANIKFLNDVLYNRLSSKDIAFKTDKQKLQVLVQAMSLSNVRFTGNYTYNGIHLNANWAYGNYEYTLAIEEKLDSGRNLLYYYPISLLKQDIKTTTNPTFEVQAILVKDFNYRRYARCIYATNKFMHNYNLYTYNVSGKRKINFDKLYFLTPARALVQNG